MKEGKEFTAYFEALLFCVPFSKEQENFCDFRVRVLTKALKNYASFSNTRKTVKPLCCTSYMVMHIFLSSRTAPDPLI